MRTNEKWADGTERLQITSNRDFSFSGVRYHVSDLPMADRERTGFRYCLDIISPDGRWDLAHDTASWEMLKFKTIKDARRWVRDWYFMIGKMEL